jgi:release factor glutamine methyltransferase
MEEFKGLDAEHREAAVQVVVDRRRRGEPLQYVLGHWQFRRLDLLVDRRALIPRPETEMLVDVALAAVLRTPRDAVVVDLGCGTGAIALAVATEASARGLHVDVHATDVSRDALELARANAMRVGATGVSFHEGSWYEALPVELRHGVDVLCANPPYVGTSERASLAVELDFEPELALFAADQDGTPGFAAVSSLVAAAPEWLAPGGTVLIEHGERQRAAVLEAAYAAGLQGTLDHDDLAGRPRLLEARGPL